MKIISYLASLFVVNKKVKQQKKTTKALSLFRTAIQTLKDVNNESFAIRSKNKSKVVKIESENVELAMLIDDNSKVINNLESLIN